MGRGGAIDGGLRNGGKRRAMGRGGAIDGGLRNGWKASSDGAWRRDWLGVMGGMWAICGRFVEIRSMRLTKFDASNKNCLTCRTSTVR